MKPQFDPKRHRRQSTRLPGYDYASQGAYFGTVCVRERECLLGRVIDSEMQRSEYGQLAHDFWNQVPVHFPHVAVDTLVIMPNHLHAIIMILKPALRAANEKGEETSPLHPPGERYEGRGAVSAPTHPPGEDKTQIGENGKETSPLLTPGLREHDRRGAVSAPSGQAHTISRIKSPTLGQIIAYYKYITTKQINLMRGTPGIPFWQRSYWDHVIRSDRALNAIRQYITDNPARWAWDTYNPAATDRDPRATELWRLLQEEAE